MILCTSLCLLLLLIPPPAPPVEFITLFVPTLLLKKESPQKDFNSHKGFTIYCYKNSTLVYTFSSIREAAKHLNSSISTITKYANNNFLFKEKYILSFTPLSYEKEALPLIYSYSNMYPSTSCTSLVIWGQNLYSTVNYRLTKYELSLFTTLPSHLYFMVIGLILSDGHLAYASNGKNVSFYFKQGFINMSFLLHCFSKLAHYCQSMPLVVSYTKNNKSFYALQFRTRFLPPFTKLALLFYPNGVKIVPENIYDLLNPISLAYWIMGDGATIKNGLLLCTNSFSIQDVVRLMNVLIIKFELDCTLIIRDKKYHMIYIKKHSLPRLQQLVLTYMHSSFLYKIFSLGAVSQYHKPLY